MSIYSRLAQWVVRTFVSGERRGSTPLSGTDSVSTPLGHLSYRQVNKSASFEEGKKRAKRVKCYLPKVDE